eukprot:765387-Hanusia_phi.AAC.5
MTSSRDCSDAARILEMMGLVKALFENEMFRCWKKKHDSSKQQDHTLSLTAVSFASDISVGQAQQILNYTFIIRREDTVGDLETIMAALNVCMRLEQQFARCHIKFNSFSCEKPKFVEEKRGGLVRSHHDITESPRSAKVVVMRMQHDEMGFAASFHMLAGNCRQRNIDLTAKDYEMNETVPLAAVLREERRAIVLDWKAQQKLLLHHQVRHHIPEEFKDKGLLWYRSCLARFLFQPNGDIAVDDGDDDQDEDDFSQTEFVQARIGHQMSLLKQIASASQGENVLAIHIRRGDKFTESPTISDDVYLTIMRGLHEKMKIHAMILESDDPVVYAKAVGWSKTFNINVTNLFAFVARSLSLSLQLMRADLYNISHLGANSKFSLQTHQINVTDYAISAIFLVARLALGNVFLGSFSSNVFRLAYVSSRAQQTRQNTPPPPPPPPPPPSLVAIC